MLRAHAVGIDREQAVVDGTHDVEVVPVHAVGVPRGGRGTEQHFCPQDRVDAGGLRIAAVVADDDAELRVRFEVCFQHLEVLAGAEIHLFQGLHTGDLGLSIVAHYLAGRTDDRGRVVVDPRRALLEYREDHVVSVLFRELAHRCGARTRNGLRVQENVVVLFAVNANVVRGAELPAHDDPGSVLGRLFDQCERPVHFCLHAAVWHGQFLQYRNSDGSV